MHYKFLRVSKRMDTDEHGNQKLKRSFVHEVYGTPAELEAFKELQGPHYREDENTGIPVWFSPRFNWFEGKLIVTQARDNKPSKIVADNTRLEIINSVIEQYKDSPLGRAIADKYATEIMEMIMKFNVKMDDLKDLPELKDEPTLD